MGKAICGNINAVVYSIARRVFATSRIFKTAAARKPLLIKAFQKSRSAVNKAVRYYFFELLVIYHAVVATYITAMNQDY